MHSGVHIWVLSVLIVVAMVVAGTFVCSHVADYLEWLSTSACQHEAWHMFLRTDLPQVLEA
jgi:hypothetical protein